MRSTAQQQENASSGIDYETLYPLLHVMCPASTFQFLSKAIALSPAGTGRCWEVHTIVQAQGWEFASTLLSNHAHVDTLKFNNLEFVSWGLGKAYSSVPPPWTHYLKSTDAVIFAIDAAAREHIEEATDELHHLFGHQELRSTKLLVFANKQDKPDSVTTQEISEKLLLEGVMPRMQYQVKASIIVREEGMHEGLSWLNEALLGRL